MTNEILTPREMAEADRRTIEAGTPGIVLMEKAGRAVADAILARHQAGTPVAVVCGPGNNGGDGFVCARLLSERGCNVHVMLLGERDAVRGDAALALQRWTGEITPIDKDALMKTGAVVDALFGAGLSRPLTGEIAAAVETINAARSAGAHVLAVDLPSGIDGTTGAVWGVAVQADETITFCRKKPGHLLLPGRLFAGQVRVADIGIADATVTACGSQMFENTPALWRASFPQPEPGGHKYSRGHAIVVSGPMFMTGAARLAARGALRVGAGLVTVAAAKDAIPVLAASLTAVMVRQAAGARGLTQLLKDKRMNAVLLGPGQGVGTATKNMVMAAAKARRSLVLDADAITSFSRQAAVLAKALKPAHEAVLTPHEGEFARLFNGQKEIIENPSKIERARAAAKAIGQIVLLKGADTVVAAPDGRAAIAANAPADLATAGSGDVLAGFVTGLLAQGMPAFEAACAAVWLHGECGQIAGRGLISEDLPEALPHVLRRLN
ncbi:NAD(P)H-hydrate dehydratase [Pseudorhodoplanes sp.]|uniref:NAD(P)H-hydrate dehydratase n=1 Tax=Pseudorhodoplanes sp. TaxID=1934341 RepID=UPI002C141458|nr:NAD(P)H-hydrate dehydratase [Pseudorhodoplanes sp.]HWK87479.1 NAD(P)H-hydrate dehydratase [Xanthobacteraceae bacterium]HWV40558.1 NAD(P)H-hydrate dehydratase [Pseudorhodoplanes sp.]